MSTRDLDRRIQFLAGWFPSDAHSVLDVGCRDGLLLKQLRETASLIVGLDINMVSLMSLEVAAVNARAEQLPFSSNSFDLVICSEVLEHLEPTVRENAIVELKRVSRKYILVSVPYYDEDLRVEQTQCVGCGKRYHLWGHQRSFQVKDVEKMFSPATPALLDIIPGHQRRFDPHLLRIKQEILKVWNHDSFATCPWCGTVSTSPQVGPFRRLGVICLSLVNFFLNPRHDYGGWIVALFQL